MKKVVLLAVGSYNPITFMHLRIFALAKDYLFEKFQWNVVGGVISPVHDAYRKKGLASQHDRLKMVELALQECNLPWIRLSTWETDQESWSRTVDTLEHHQIEVNGGLRYWFKDSTEDDHIQVMLLCGVDVLESFAVPGLWDDKQLIKILTQFGVVCITRKGYDFEEIIRSSPVLSQYREHVVPVVEWFENKVSSTLIRDAVRKRLSIGMLVATAVDQYIKEHNLFVEEDHLGVQKPLVFVFKASKVDGHSDAYEENFTKAGFRVCLIPVLNFQFLGVPEYAGALSMPENYSGLILTTQRAVEALLIAVKADSTLWETKNLALWNQKPIYVVGEATAAAARAAGLKPVGQEAGNEAALAEIIKANKHLHTDPLLFPCGNLRLENLRIELEKADIPLECVLVYETSAHPQLAEIVHEELKKQGFPDVNLFFSPSGIQFMDEILRKESLAFKQTKNVAIGPTTAEALKRLSYPIHAIAARPDPESALEAVRSLFGSS